MPHGPPCTDHIVASWRDSDPFIHDHEQACEGRSSHVAGAGWSEMSMASNEWPRPAYRASSQGRRDACGATRAGAARPIRNG